MEMGRQMLQVGFMLCLVLGIGGYLAPFLTGYANEPACDPNKFSMRGCGPVSMMIHGLAGLIILGSFAVESHYPVVGAGMRGWTALVYLCVFGKLYRFPRKRSAQAWLFWLACWMVPTGLLAPFFWPDYRIAGLHLLFIGGFSLMIYSFGLLVVLSHGADAALLQGRLIPLWSVGAAVMIAAILRFVADVDAWHYKMWIHAASGTWVLAAAFWLIYVFPKLWRAPQPEFLIGHGKIGS